MDFELPEELRMLKETLRRFIDNEVIPIERDAYDGPEMVPAIREKLEDRAKELGIWGVDVPESLGGLGMGLLARTIIWEETGRTIAFPRRKKWIFGPDVSPLLAEYANAEQTEKYLKPCIDGYAEARLRPDRAGCGR